MLYFSKEQIAESYYKILWFDKYCLDSGWINEAFPFPSKETIDSLIDNAMKENKNYVITKADERLEFIKFVKECLELEIVAINEFLNNEAYNVTMYEKIKSMSLDDMAVFLNSILCRDNLLDDMYCKGCYEKLGYCPVGEGDCEHKDVDVVLWFLKQPYDSLQSMLDDCSKHYQRRDSE